MISLTPEQIAGGWKPVTDDRCPLPKVRTVFQRMFAGSDGGRPYMSEVIEDDPTVYLWGGVIAYRSFSPVPPQLTTGHCANRKKPGGCPLHNLFCGYPKCDEGPAIAAQVEKVAS